jgi:hypothetical protein
VGGQEDRPVGDAVLLGSDQLLAVQNENRDIARALGEEGRHRTGAHLRHVQGLGHESVDQELVAERRSLPAQEREEGEVLMLLGLLQG